VTGLLGASGSGSGSSSHVAELVIAGILGVLGLRSLVHWLRSEFEANTLSEHALFALHVTARVATWFMLAGAFVGYAVLAEPQRFRWYVVVIFVLAGVQLVTAFSLGRGPVPPRDGPMP
jgi:hypothetical protein